MPIVNTIYSFGQFFDSIPDSRKKNFSYSGWENLYNYLDELSDDTGENVEFDAVAFCCEYTECESIDEFLRDYNHALDEMGIVSIGGVYVPEFLQSDDVTISEHVAQYENGDYNDELLEAIRDYLEYNTSVVACEENCIMFAAF